MSDSVPTPTLLQMSAIQDFGVFIRNGARAGRRERSLTPTGVGVAVILAVCAAYGSWQVFHWGGAANRSLIGDVFFYPVSAAAVVAAKVAADRVRVWPRLRRAWLLLAAGALAYLFGDVAQTVYEVAGHKPYPSVADALYLMFYPLM